MSEGQSVNLSRRQYLLVAGVVLAIVLVGVFSQTFAGDVLAPALAGTVALAVLFVTQNLARYTRQQADAASQQARAAEEQLEQLRSQSRALAEASKEAQSDADESQRLTRTSIEVARLERLDALAPRVGVIIDSIDWGIEDNANNLQSITGEFMNVDPGDTARPRFKLFATYIITNYDVLPVFVTITATKRPNPLFNGGRLTLLPGRSEVVRYDEVALVEHWDANIQQYVNENPRHPEREGYQTVNFQFTNAALASADNYRASIGSPRIERDGSRWRVYAEAPERYHVRLIRDYGRPPDEISAEDEEKRRAYNETVGSG